MQRNSFEAYVPTNSETWKKFFAQVSDRSIVYQSFYTIDEHNQKRAGKSTESIKVISPSEAAAEKAKSLSSSSSEKQSTKAVKSRLEKSVQEEKEKFIKPLSTVKKPKQKKRSD